MNNQRTGLTALLLIVLLGGCGGGGGAAEGGAGPTPPPQVLDIDDDGAEDQIDNCIDDWNPNQSDDDRDGLGNPCDRTFDPPMPPPMGTSLSTPSRVLVAFFLASDQEPNAALQQSMRRAVDGTDAADGVRTMMQRYTYGAYPLEFDYTDWVRLPHDSAHYNASLEARYSRTPDAMDVLISLGYLDADVVYVLVFDDTVMLPGERSPCRGGGLGNENFPDGVGFVHLGGVNGACIDRRIVAHELLHTSGLGHDEAVVCDSFIGGAPLNLAAATSGGELCGDGGSGPSMAGYYSHGVMGLGIGHPGSPSKLRAGWITGDQVVLARGNLTAQIESLETATAGTKAVVVPIGDGDLSSETPAYWVEHRVSDDRTSNGPHSTSTTTYDFLRIWAFGPGILSDEEDLPLDSSEITFQSARFPEGLSLDDGDDFHDLYRGIRITRVSSSRMDGIPTTRVDVVRSALRSYPGAVGVVRPNRPAVIRFVNEGEVLIALQMVALVGRDKNLFRVDDDDCSDRELAPGAECGVLVSSTEGEAATVVRNAVIEIPTSDALRPRAVHSIRMVPASYSIPDPLEN